LCFRPCSSLLWAGIEEDRRPPSSLLY
jgi:hypothetical protein